MSLDLFVLRRAMWVTPMDEAIWELGYSPNVAPSHLRTLFYQPRMDSLSQIVLGAAVAELVAGKKLGNRAILWGAIAGTIPDLDIITQLFLDEFHAMSLHRGFSHSLIFCILLSPAFAWLMTKIFRRSVMGFRDWTMLFFWCFITHIGLDCLTTWGTQVFWPLDVRLSTNSIFVADPLYTLPFMLILIVLMFFKRTSLTRRKLGRIALIVSTSYLALGFVFKKNADSAFAESIKEQGLQVVNFESRPSPLNIILWQANVETKDGYYLGFYSLLDEDKNIRYSYVPKQHELLDPFKGDATLEKVLHMTQQFYAVEKTDSNYVINDLRFGFMDGYEENPSQFVFRYHIYPRDGQDVLVDVQDPPSPKSEEISIAMAQLWHRMLGNKTPLERK